MDEDLRTRQVIDRLLVAIESRDLRAVHAALHPNATWQNVPQPAAELRPAVIALLANILCWSDQVRWDVHRDMMQIMMTAVAELCHIFGPAMVTRGFGRIVNIASVAAFVPGQAGGALYPSVKAFVLRLSQSLGCFGVIIQIVTDLFCSLLMKQHI